MSSSEPQEVLYVLELEHSKYYVGRTRKPFEVRFQEHLSGKYSIEWIRLHKPVRVMYVKPYKLFAERNTTFKMMYTHGIDNVRGAEWCKVTLTDQEIQINQMLLHSYKLSYKDSNNYLVKSIVGNYNEWHLRNPNEKLQKG